MRPACVISVLIALSLPMALQAQTGQTPNARPQPAPIYDHSYTGPRNYQGLPTYEPVQRPQRQSLQNPYTAQPQAQYPNQYGQYQTQPNPYGNLYGQRQPAQQFKNTPFHRLYRGASRIGGYFWQYMPAPVRGAQNQYIPEPGSGNVIITNVGPSP
jgi:hypothetical protein